MPLKKIKRKGAINPGDRDEEDARAFRKQRQKEAAKIEMVSKLAKRQKKGKYYKAAPGASKATDTEGALTTFNVQKIMDERFKKGKGKDVDFISDRRLASKEGSMKTGGLTGGQKKLDKNKNNRIDAEDFKILKAEKKGKPMKAALGAMALGIGGKKMMDKNKMSMPAGMGAAALLAKKKKDILGKKRGGGIKKDPTKPVNPFEKKSLKFMERRKKLGTLKSAIGKGGRLGAAIAALGIAGAGAAKLGQTIGRKMSEKKKNKKMGGGMMKKYSKGGDSKLQKGIEGTTFKPKKQFMGVFGDSKATQKKFYDMTSAAKRDAHKKGRSEGKKFRARTFVDRETGTLRLDTVSNRKRFGKKVYKAPDVSYVEPRKYNKGGGADTGRMGELRSKLGVASNKVRRTNEMLKKIRPKLQAPERKPMKPLKAMGGGMMMKPMGYKSGTSVKAKCKLGRNKPTKMY